MGAEPSESVGATRELLQRIADWLGVDYEVHPSQYECARVELDAALERERKRATEPDEIVGDNRDLLWRIAWALGLEELSEESRAKGRSVLDAAMEQKCGEAIAMAWKRRWGDEPSDGAVRLVRDWAKHWALEVAIGRPGVVFDLARRIDRVDAGPAAERIEGACALLIALGLSTGHGDDWDAVVREARSGLDAALARARAETIDRAITEFTEQYRNAEGLGASEVRAFLDSRVVHWTWPWIREKEEESDHAAGQS